MRIALSVHSTPRTNRISYTYPPMIFLRPTSPRALENLFKSVGLDRPGRLREARLKLSKSLVTTSCGGWTIPSAKTDLPIFMNPSGGATPSRTARFRSARITTGMLTPLGHCSWHLKQIMHSQSAGLDRTSFFRPRMAFLITIRLRREVRRPEGQVPVQVPHWKHDFTVSPLILVTC